MVRMVSVFLAALLALAAPAMAQIPCGAIGVGVRGGMMQPTGGDEEFEDSGLIVGLSVMKPLTERVCVSLDYTHGETENGEALPEEDPCSRFSSWGEADEFKTVWNRAELTGIYNFMPEDKVNPFVSLGLGMTFWEVQDWCDSQVTVPDGYDTDGTLRKLRGTDLTASLGLGVEFFATRNVSVAVGGKYSLLFMNDKDNVGLSSALGPDYVDANNAIMDVYASVNFYIGPMDCDGDGIFEEDQCPRIPEDIDGFEDEDGCPDPDNDQDGILDVDDACPDDPEDFDGFEDEDGCPDLDRDGDGIMDDDDACPDDPEDIDGFQDADGCPDPDNDGDGVLDGMDACPGTPKGVVVDAKGCPKKVEKVEAPAEPLEVIGEEMISVTVYFDLASDALREDTKQKLSDIIDVLKANPDHAIEIEGHACDLGTEEFNQSLSMLRAHAVRMYLARRGIEEDRISISGKGETEPVAANDTEENRRLNRRVIVTTTAR